MKAVLFHEFGGPEVLQSTELNDPIPGTGEVLIRIHAAGVNPADTKIRKGLFLQRIPHAFPVIPGWDAAGVIEKNGDGATLFKPGDEVYAYCRKPVVQFGAYAERIVLPETQIALKPKTMTFEEAASVPLAALTAWQSLMDAAGLKAGQSVLIHAGAGGVGGFAIQIAKHAGAFVIATASRRNHDYVRGLGADMIIDYTEIDFRDALLDAYSKGVDVAFDTVGGDVQSRSGDVVRTGGVLVSLLAFKDEAALKSKGIQVRYVFVAPNREQLGIITGLIDQGKIKSHLAAVLPLSNAQEAHRMMETQHTVGKIVLRCIDRYATFIPTPG